MKQILQNLGSGETLLADVPTPRRGAGSVLIRTSRSLVSLGTEKMLIDFGKGGLIAKARSQPDKVKQVLQKVKTDGLLTTIDAVKAKLDTPIPLGYCNVGHVAEADSTATYRVGDRVVSNGPHAEFVSVPLNLTAGIPDSVSDEMAAFTVVGAIGLQGIRLLNPTLGERVVVSGLGLIGLLAVQILKASGCQVLGIDFDAKKLELARSFGAETCDLSAGQDPVAVAENWTDGVGVDAVLITASAKTDELIHQAATMCRQRGRIVLVGVIGLNLQRADFYEKELSFQVSCSYGPGRYDDNYEKRGLDYPIGFVRWTEKRNFEAILQLMSDGRIDVDPLITHRFAFDDALKGYEAVGEKGAMGIVLEYGDSNESRAARGEKETQKSGQCSGDSKQTGDEASTDGTRAFRKQGEDVQHKKDLSLASRNSPLATDIGVAFIGAGGFTTRMLLPLLPKQGVDLRTIVSGTGVSAAHAKSKFGFAEASSDYASILADDSVDAVFITTPHNMHGRMVCDALNANKHVFVEKPLALTLEELAEVEACCANHPDRLLMIGFNRRFSPHSVAMKDWLLGAPSNKSVIITVNAGAIPADHWTQDPLVGGGRIVGEACHFIDLARFLVGSPIEVATAFPIRGGDGRLGDCVTIQLTFMDGSTGTVHYLANGSKDFPKERVEVFAGGKVMVCDNFRLSKEIGGKRKLKTSKQDKGHEAELAAFLKAIQEGRVWPITAEELFEVSRIAIECQSVAAC
ncbi:bi-domain-containing oxidoreductase [Novipirellula artificiosorum]|uniref:4-carboxy-2-hydroxymuconate-6-semialdehyde dehydrogenase n=1 Tax=Novipirellula artificiosorum TaxID=2528016 RepID=A0A5C6DCE3_9BACT|nr:bi-domain-containing oxidoreductase [Novipirellula artificiosorum]TWU32609.1 4-carboxy-2-hydroxymuconate-6-semialdehyde dehydrogenase [Novipirellula artificiosorum]